MDDICRVASAIANPVRPCFGPFGQDQLVITETQKIVTNSSSRILAQAKAGSPLAKVLLGHYLRFSENLGDGTGALALLIEGALEQCSECFSERM